MGENTPLMRQYLQIKRQYKDAILFFRLGDFYEMFFEDARIASKELEITLTSRDRDKSNCVPMCGVPYHSADGYIARLISKGYKVAICEQVESPDKNKKLVRREVVRVITPGTVTDEKMLEEKENNFLASIYGVKNSFGLAVVDVSTGEFKCTEFMGNNALQSLINELARLSPKECITNSAGSKYDYLAGKMKELGINYITHFKDNFRLIDCELLIREQFPNIKQLFHYGRNRACAGAVGMLLCFLRDTQKKSLSHINKLEYYRQEQFMILDSSTRQNLEIIRTLRKQEKKGSLLGVIDHTVTAMGGRMLKKWLEEPLLDQKKIVKRQNAVQELVDKGLLRRRVREIMDGVYDLERLAGRVSYENANARDLLALRQSLEKLPELKKFLKENALSVLLKELEENIDLMEDAVSLLSKSIKEPPPLSLKEGGIIKEGYDQEVDRLHKAAVEGKHWIASLESQERNRTGIKSLKIGFNKVFGYYFEISKSNLHMVPGNYHRKQTLVNAERFITPRLKELEELVMGAEERVKKLEYELFVKIREQVGNEIYRIQQVSKSLAALDSLSALAEAAVRYGYKRPEVDNSQILLIKGGRHPVVERTANGENFVPNDTYLDSSENRIALITGPNMAGKSTYMRQVALIVILAQAGSFVPALEARIGIIDRIFTRAGASDDLATGQSTFMIEMLETAQILFNAGRQSLIILDEVGRGTSTYDGMSIARAVIEFIHEKISAKTLFSTHYHELTELEQQLSGIKNYTMAVKEQGEEIVFLHRVIPGKSDRSYGINVARLSGLPREVIKRAEIILKSLETPDENFQFAGKACNQNFCPVKDSKNEELQLTAEEKNILNEVREIDISTLTPLEALNKLYLWQSTLNRIKHNPEGELDAREE